MRKVFCEENVAPVVLTIHEEEEEEEGEDTHSVSAGRHVLLGVVVVLNQFGSKLVQGLRTNDRQELEESRSCTDNPNVCGETYGDLLLLGTE